MFKIICICVHILHTCNTFIFGLSKKIGFFSNTFSAKSIININKIYHKWSALILNKKYAFDVATCQSMWPMGVWPKYFYL